MALPPECARPGLVVAGAIAIRLLRTALPPERVRLGLVVAGDAIARLLRGRAQASASSPPEPARPGLVGAAATQVGDMKEEADREEEGEGILFKKIS